MASNEKNPKNKYNLKDLANSTKPLPNNLDKRPSKESGRTFCDYNKVADILVQGGANDLLLFKLQASLVRPGGAVDENAVRAFAMIVKGKIKDDK